jgi:hypothetical protein
VPVQVKPIEKETSVKPTPASYSNKLFTASEMKEKFEQFVAKEREKFESKQLEFEAREKNLLQLISDLKVKKSKDSESAKGSEKKDDQKKLVNELKKKDIERDENQRKHASEIKKIREAMQGEFDELNKSHIEMKKEFAHLQKENRELSGKITLQEKGNKKEKNQLELLGKEKEYGILL